MARQSRSPALFCALLALALLSLAATATAANSLGMAVAGAPSMFVLAVHEATGEKDTRAARQDGVDAQREPRQEAPSVEADRNRQAATQAAAQAGAPAAERKISLR